MAKEMGRERSFEDSLVDKKSAISQLIRLKARNLVRQPAFCDVEAKDIEQELVVELLKQADHFEPSRSCEVTFASRVIESTTLSMIRARLAEKRDYRRETCSLNDDVWGFDGESVARVQTLDASAGKRHTGQSPRSDEELAELRSDIRGLIESLPADLRPVAELLQKMSAHVAGRELGISRRQMAAAVGQIRRRFECSELREYLP